MAGNYNLGTATGRILIDGAGAEIGFGIAQKAGKEFFDAIATQLQSLKDFGQNLMKAGAVGAAGFAVAGNAAAAFEQRLSAVKAVSGASADEMKAISDAALEIGAATSFSATEAASAFEELVKAGISVSDTLDGAALATANLAAAGEIALPRAAEIAANAMNNFSLTGKEMPRIADLVAGAANASAISVEEFAQSLSQVGAVANLAGVSFDDTAVAIAEMGNAGIKGSDAGTSLKTMLLNLQPVTAAQVSKFQELGLVTFSAEKSMAAMAKKGITPVGDSLLDVRRAVSDYLEATEGIPNDTKQMGKAVDEWLMKNGAMQNAFFDTSGKAKGLGEMQEALAKATAGMSEEQKLAALEVLFGADAIRAAAIMAKNGSAGFNELAASMGKVTAAQVAETRLDNVRGSIEKLKGAFETLLIQIGSIFLPVFKRLVDKLTEGVTWLTTVSERARNFFVSLGAVGTGLALVVGGLATVTAMIAPFLIKMLGIALIQKVIMGVVGAVKFLALAFTTATGPISFYRIVAARVVLVYGQISAAAYTAATAVGVFGKVLAFALGPWGKLIQLAFLLGAVAVTLYNTWDPFKELVDGIAGVISGIFTTAVDGVVKLMGDVERGFKGVSGAGDPVSVLFNSLGAVAAILWADMQRLGEIFMTDVVPALQELWAILQSAFGESFAEISGVIQRDLMPALKELSDAFINDLWPALKDAGEILGPIVGFLLKIAVVMIGNFYTALITVASFVLGTLLPAIIRFAGPVLTGLIDAITAVAGFIITYLITPFIDFVTFLTGTVIPGIIDFGIAIGQGFQDAFKAVAGFIDTWLVKPITGFIEFLTGTGKKAEEGGSGISEGISTGISDVQKWVDDYLVKPFTDFVNDLIKIKDDTIANVTAIAKAIADHFKPLTDTIGAIVGFIIAVATTAAKILGGIFDFVLTVWVAIWGFIFAAISALWTAFVDWLGIVVGGFINWWNEVWGGFGNWISEVWGGFINWIKEIWGGFINWVIEVVNGFFAWWNPIWQAFADSVSQIWGGFINWIMEIWGGFINWIVEIVNGFFAWWNEAWAGAMSGVADIWNGFVGMVRDIWNGFVGWLRDAYNALNTLTDGAIGDVVDGFVQGWNDLVSGAQEAWRGFTSWVEGIPGQIQDLFNGATSWLAGAGGKIIDGLLGGLRGAADDVKNFFTNLTADIPNWKGPEPLDKVLLLPAGKMIIHSLWKGLDSGKDAIHALLSDLNTSIPATLDAVLNPDLQSTIDGQLSGKATFTSINKAPVVTVEGAKVTANFDAKLYLGDKDITDMVDLRVEEHFDGASSLISTGVNS